MIVTFQAYSALDSVSIISTLVVYLLLKSPALVVQRTGLVILFRYFYLFMISH